MRFKQALLTSSLLMGLLTACTNQSKPAASWADFLQPSIKYQASTITQRLKDTQLPFEQLGSIRYAGQVFSLPMVRIQRASKQAPVCIFAGVHGNEIAGTEAALSLIEALANDKTLYPDTNFVILPLVNPWGWERGFRYNFEGQDIARNFALEGTQETALIKPLLAREQCQLVVDLHEDSTHSGFYLLTYANPDPVFTPKLVQAVVDELGIAAAQNVPQGVYQVAAKEFATNPRPTLAQYAREQGAEQTYIIETSMKLPLQQRVAIQRRVLDKLIENLVH
ncbi:MAG: DUF2817 domain-containing protein [Thiolinea sp.]